MQATSPRQGRGLLRVLWLSWGLLAAGASAFASPFLPVAEATAAAGPLRIIGVADGLPSAGINDITQDQRGYLWLATDDGLARFDGRGFRVWRRGAGEAGALPGNRVQRIRVLEDDRLQVDVDGHGRWIFDRPRQQFSPAGVSPAPTPEPRREVLQDRAGDTWRVGPQGLQHLPGAGKTVDRWPSPRWEGPVRSVFEDREGGLWFGADVAGLLYLPPTWRRFHLLSRPSDADADVLAGASADTAWLANAAGLWRLTLDTARHERVPVAPAWPAEPVQALLARQDGSLWLAQGQILSRLVPDAPGGWRRQVPAAAAWPVRQLLESADGALWLVGDRQIERRAPSGKRQAMAGVSPLWHGPDGQPWRLQDRQLQHWQPSTQNFVAVPGAPKGEWLALAAGEAGVVWLAAQARLEQWQWRDGQWLPMARFGSAQGVPAVDRLALALDAAGQPWLATPRGLWRLDADKARLRRFGQADGMGNQALGEGPLWLAPGGIGLAATAGGWQLFDSEGLGPQARPAPPLVLESVQLRRHGQPVLLPSDASLLRLGPDDRELRFAVRLVSFTEPSAHRFRFLLEGYDPGWVDVGADGVRVLPRLAPGRYPLRVSGAAVPGEWSEPRMFTVLVDPPWWGTRLALAGSGLGLMAGLSVLALAHRARLRRREAWQLARARQQLAEQHSDAKTRFLATLGHEIRTPMTGVLGMAELLQGSALDPQQRARVDAIQGAGRHLLRLVNDTLDLARIEAGKLVLEDAAFALRPLLEELAGLLRPLAEAKGLHFHLHCDGDVAAGLRGDATRVRQILLNLAGNAIKFCERGELVIHVGRREPQGVVIVVRDTGPGLAADQQARLFRRFEQGGGFASGNRYGGSGLGLAISQELAAAMGGSISVRSEPGRGACFRVELPLPAAVPLAALESAPVLVVPGRRVLLVEDDPVVAAVVQDLLRQQGHTVGHAAHGLAAMAALETTDFDLALLDLDLPGLDGFQLARLLRAQGRRLPLLALTARTDGDAERQAMAAGMDGFLRKPVTGAMLAEALAAVPVAVCD